MSERKMLEEKEIASFDFVINALLQHERSLSNLATTLEKILKQVGYIGDFSDQIQKVENDLTVVETQISNLCKSLPDYSNVPVISFANPIIAQCKEWEDFRTIATNAEIISFLFNKPDSTFEVNALKGVFSPVYTGNFPAGLDKNEKTLKSWLSTELGVDEVKIFEGSLGPK